MLSRSFLYVIYLAESLPLKGFSFAEKSSLFTYNATHYFVSFEMTALFVLVQ